MPLQVRIEEGPRSKAVRVGGLQYCQYSQEKISLITVGLRLCVRMYVSLSYMYVCVCMYACMYICMYVCVYLFIY